MNASRPIVLVLLGCFWPGNDSSGPNQSFIALATALSDHFDFRVVARDGPVGETRPINEAWVDLGFAKARYCPAGRLGAVGLRRILNETPHDLLWLNSVFDREFTLPALVLRRLGWIPRKPVLLSPRGEFGSGALGVKPERKRLFLEAARKLRFWRGITLHATSEAEARDMAEGARGTAPIVIAPNIRLLLDAAPFAPSEDGALRLAFVGRIVPVKQLDYALDVLGHVKALVNFEVFGPAEDEAYWRRCQDLIARLPPNIRVRWHGETSNDGVVAALSRTDLFFLPTGGENFGHAIFEALCCGAPLLISDQTPWRNLAAAHAGWDLPLAASERFVAAIEELAAMPASGRAELRLAAREVARRWTVDSGANARNVAMLKAALAAGAAP